MGWMGRRERGGGMGHVTEMNPRSANEEKTTSSVEANIVHANERMTIIAIQRYIINAMKQNTQRDMRKR
jgi:hypothetical protein